MFTTNCHGTLDLCSNQTLHRFRRSSEEVVVVPDLFITSTDSVIVTNKYCVRKEEEKRKNASSNTSFSNSPTESPQVQLPTERSDLCLVEEQRNYLLHKCVLI
mmetsp:Transcript_10132/g.16705  ORF Transcript_10132/g.16705 Transcript_10132/m.16705 type:complete len:103 (+) Transcript_10132:652-960(+)